MPRRAKRSRLHLNNQISRSQALAYLAQNEIDQCTVPYAKEQDPQSEEDDVDQERDDNYFDSFAGTAPSTCNSDLESSLEGSCPIGEDLPAGDSYSAEQQLNVMLGGNLHNERRKLVVEEEEKLQDEEELAPGLERKALKPGTPLLGRLFLTNFGIRSLAPARSLLQLALTRFQSLTY